MEVPLQVVVVVAGVAHLRLAEAEVVEAEGVQSHPLAEEAAEVVVVVLQ